MIGTRAWRHFRGCGVASIQRAVVGTSLSAATLLLSACAQPERTTPISFPPPPSAPRLTYLGRLYALPIHPRPKGAFRRWLREEPGFLQTPLDRPTGLAADDHHLFVCDAGAGRVLAFDFAEASVRMMDRLAKPADVELDDAGRVFVAEAAAGRIRVVDRRLDRERRIELHPRTPRPTALAIVGNRLFIADAQDGSVLCGDLPAVHEGSATMQARRIDPWRGYDAGLAGPRRQPAGIGALLGRIWVTDALSGDVCIADEPFDSWTTAPSTGLLRPRHVATLPDGGIVIADAARGILEIRGDQGTPPLTVADPSILTCPVGVCVSTGLLRYYAPLVPTAHAAKAVVFVSDQGPPGRIAVFAY